MEGGGGGGNRHDPSASLDTIGRATGIAGSMIKEVGGGGGGGGACLNTKYLLRIVLGLREA